VQILKQHQMIPTMSRPTNPYDNASCESFLKTLKREEIYAQAYRDLDHLRANIEAFIDRYYNPSGSTPRWGIDRRKSLNTPWRLAHGPARRR
jgi:transposase InsO family protein